MGARRAPEKTCMKPVKVGVIGCGHVSDVYLKSCKTFGILDVAACSDLVPERAEAKAREHGIPKACSSEELLADPEIEIVLNLTIPSAHGLVGMADMLPSKASARGLRLCHWA
jgi:predicted dehydrogenase